MKTPLFKRILRLTLTVLGIISTIVSIAQNTAPIAVSDTISVRIGSTFMFDPMTNDYDPDGDTFTIYSVGHCSIANASVVNNNQLRITVNFAALTIVDTIKYILIDQNNNKSSLGKIIVNLRPNRARDSLTINNIYAPIGSWGNDFWSKIESSATFRAPKSKKTSTIFTSLIWFSAYDAQNVLHTAADVFNVNGSDFNPGPIRDSVSKLDDLDSIYQRVWKLTKAEINNHRNNYWQSSYIMPEAILNWPAMGNVSNGMASNLAKYTDVDNDGIYNPANGDYPNIKGDECILSIYNDDCAHNESNGVRFKIEIHLLSYAFNCPNDTALQNTIFQHYEIYNRSNNNYHDFRIGSFTDFDIGFPMDDYVGCDTLRNSYYAYNGDNNDNSGDPRYYGINPPAQGITFLSNKMNSFMAGAQELNYGGPIYPIHRHYCLQGLYNDGSPITVGGNGQNGTINTKYSFFGNPADTNQWVMKPSIIQPSEIRGIGSIGPFSLKKDSSISFDMAYIYARDTTKTNIENVGLLKHYIDKIQWAYDNDTTECGGNFSTINNSINEKQINIYPNPTSNEIFIAAKFNLEKANYQIYNIAGQLVKYGQINNSPEQISIRDLNSGIYFILVTKEKDVYTKKFIVR